MEEVEVFRFHPEQPTVKKTMLLSEFKAMKKQKGYVYRAYQIGFNKTVLNTKK